MTQTMTESEYQEELKNLATAIIPAEPGLRLVTAFVVDGVEGSPYLPRHDKVGTHDSLLAGWHIRANLAGSAAIPIPAVENWERPPAFHRSRSAVVDRTGRVYACGQVWASYEHWLEQVSQELLEELELSR